MMRLMRLMRLTERQLNRTLLRRQLLVEREPLGVVDAVRRLVGLQAQHAAAPYVALWNRIANFDPAELDSAFAAHRVVKATLLRITLHAVAADDRDVFHRAMVQTLRAARLSDARFSRTGLTSADADAGVADLLTFLAEPRGNSEVDAFFAERFPDLPETGVWWALRSYAPLIHAPGPHPWTYGPRPSYLAAPSPPPGAEALDADTAMVELALVDPAGVRACDARRPGPVLHPLPPTGQAGLRRSDRRARVYAGQEKSRSSTWRERSSPTRTRRSPLTARHVGQRAAGPHRPVPADPAEYRATVIRRNGDVLPMLVVDGYVAGVWRPVERGIEATAFRRLPPTTWDGLAAEAEDLRAMLADREPFVFGRYGHWWKSIDWARR